MIKVENIEVFNFEGAIRGMRNPLNSWDKSDSKNGCCKPSNYTEHVSCDDCPYSEIAVPCKPYYQIGKNDLDLMHRLFVAGAEHRKYLRQIFVSMDITAPTYWIAELDTYKVGTTRNSCSFMHRGLSKPFEISDFSTHTEGADLSTITDNAFDAVINVLNELREVYLKTNSDIVFQQIRCLLPSGYNQRFTLTMTYENVFNIINQRQNHRLSEWRELCEILKDLPYVREIGGINDGE